MVRFPLLFLILLTAFGLPRGAGAQGVFDITPDTLFVEDGLDDDVVVRNSTSQTILLDSLTMRWPEPDNTPYAWIAYAIGQPTGGTTESHEFFSGNDTWVTDLSFMPGDTLLMELNFDPCGFCLTADQHPSPGDTISAVDTLVFHANGFVATDTLIIDWSFPVADERVPAATPNLELAVHPNPASGHAEVTMNVESFGVTTVSVFDSRGRRISELHHGALPAGQRTLIWNSSGVPPGIYIIHAETEEATLSHTLTIIH